MCSAALLTISSGESLSLLAPLLRTGSYVGAFKGMIIVVLYFRRVLCYFLTFFLSLQAAGLLGIGRYKSHFLDIEHFREMNGRIGDRPLSFQTMLPSVCCLGSGWVFRMYSMKMLSRQTGDSGSAASMIVVVVTPLWSAFAFTTSTARLMPMIHVR